MPFKSSSLLSFAQDHLHSVATSPMCTAHVRRCQQLFSDVKKPLGSRLVYASALLQLAIQVAERVQALHACGILHCDLKPENILVDSPAVMASRFNIHSLDPRIIDLGGSRMMDSQGQAHGALMGTTRYWSDEKYNQKQTQPGFDCWWYDVQDYCGMMFEVMSGVLATTSEEPLRAWLDDTAVVQYYTTIVTQSREEQCQFLDALDECSMSRMSAIESLLSQGMAGQAVGEVLVQLLSIRSMPTNSVDMSGVVQHLKGIYSRYFTGRDRLAEHSDEDVVLFDAHWWPQDTSRILYYLTHHPSSAVSEQHLQQELQYFSDITQWRQWFAQQQKDKADKEVAMRQRIAAREAQAKARKQQAKQAQLFCHYDSDEDSGSDTSCKTAAVRAPCAKVPAAGVDVNRPQAGALPSTPGPVPTIKLVNSDAVPVFMAPDIDAKVHIHVISPATSPRKGGSDEEPPCTPLRQPVPVVDSAATPQYHDSHVLGSQVDMGSQGSSNRTPVYKHQESTATESAGLEAATVSNVSTHNRTTPAACCVVYEEPAAVSCGCFPGLSKLSKKLRSLFGRKRC